MVSEPVRSLIRVRPVELLLRNSTILASQVNPNDIVLGGWDISSMNLAEGMTRAKVGHPLAASLSGRNACGASAHATNPLHFATAINSVLLLLAAGSLV